MQKNVRQNHEKQLYSSQSSVSISLNSSWKEKIDCAMRQAANSVRIIFVFWCSHFALSIWWNARFSWCGRHVTIVCLFVSRQSVFPFLNRLSPSILVRGMGLTILFVRICGIVLGCAGIILGVVGIFDGLVNYDSDIEFLVLGLISTKLFGGMVHWAHFNFPLWYHHFLILITLCLVFSFHSDNFCYVRSLFVRHN